MRNCIVYLIVFCDVAVIAGSCGGTRRNGEVCNFEPCGPGLVCNAAKRCVPEGSVDGGDDGLAMDAESPDGPQDGHGEPDGGMDAEGGCSTSGMCEGDKPICTAGQCSGCTTNTECAEASPETPSCELGTGRCVGCLGHGDCPAEAPACILGTCGACTAAGAPANACSERGGGEPVCGPAGGCVECASSTDCSEAARPICSENVCRGCEADAECEAKLGAEPGVCLDDAGGRCAGVGEVVYVENVSGKCKAGGPGSAAMPYCGLAEGMAAANSGGKAAVVLKGPQGVFGASYGGPGKLLVVGRAGARIAPGAGIGLDVTGGELVARNLTVRGGDQPGIAVRPNAALALSRSQVLDNAGGGILVEGGKLVLETTKVSNNGPGQFGLATWGGILFSSPAVGTRLERVSVVGNKGPGISCSGQVPAMGVLAMGNSTLDIAPTCNITSCTAAGPTCGSGE